MGPDAIEVHLFASASECNDESLKAKGKADQIKADLKRAGEKIKDDFKKY